MAAKHFALVTGRAGPRACAAYGRRQAVHTIVRVCAECKDADLEQLSGGGT